MALCGSRGAPVLVWMFSGIELEPGARDCARARLLTLYERARGRSGSMHVGLAMGVLAPDGVVSLEAWEFSANAGRLSGMCPLVVRAADAPPPPLRLVVRSALYLRVSSALAHEFLDNFCSAGASPFAAQPKQYPGLPCAGVPYPAFGRIVRRACANLLPCALGALAAPADAGHERALPGAGLRRSVFPGLEGQMLAFHAEAQCAQFAMLPMLSMMCAQAPECSEHLSCAEQARIRETARGGVGLHPHVVRALLASMPAFVALGGADAVRLDGQPVALARVEVDNLNSGRVLPDLASWQRFRLAL